MTRLFQATWTFPVILVSVSFCLADLDLVYEWKYIDYVWNSEATKAEANNDGTYDYRKIIPYDVQPLPDGRVLVATPRYYNNPASLSTISEETSDSGPLLSPYPDWSWHTADNCSGITSVNRVVLDNCDRIWIVDSGKIGNEQVCPAKILAFDPKSNELLQSFEIPKELSHSPDDESRGRLQIQVVETSEDSCEDFWVYISDMDGYALLIWDGIDIWRLENEIFHPTSEGETFDIAGESFTHRSGPEGLLLTPPGFLTQTYLLMKSLSYYKTYAATTEELHNSKYGSQISYYRTNFTAPSQEPGKGWAKNGGTLVASFTTEMAVGCWNLRNPLHERYVTVIAQNDTTLQYVPSTKIVTAEESDREILWLMSNRMQRFALFAEVLGTMDFTEINYRVLRADMLNLVEGTVCEPGEVQIADSIEDKDFFYFETS